MESGKIRKHMTMSTEDQPNSWLFSSTISAMMKEYPFMKVLNDDGYPTPTPNAQNRHLVARGLIRVVSST